MIMVVNLYLILGNVVMVHRKKTSLILACSIFSLIVSPSQADEKVSMNNKDMRNWGIIPAKEFLVYTLPDIPDCSVGKVRSTGRPYTKEIYLRRPGGKYASAVICSKKDGTVLLNPEGFNYGPIPSLNKITKSQADLLWGSKNGKEVIGNVVTYKLLPNFGYKTNKEVLLDIVFEDSKIKKYKIRSEFMKSLGWTEV